MVTSNEILIPGNVSRERIGINNGFSLGKCIVCNVVTRNKYCSNRCKSKHFRNKKRGGTIPSHPKEPNNPRGFVSLNNGSADFDKIELKDFMTMIELAKIRACMLLHDRDFYVESYGTINAESRVYKQEELPFSIVIKLWNILCDEEDKEQYAPTENKAEYHYHNLIAHQLHALHKLFNFDNEIILKL